MIYKTYGTGCEKFNFKRVSTIERGNMYLWQPVKKWLCFWVRDGKHFWDHKDMFYPKHK